MLDGERVAIFDDADDTTLVIHVGKAELTVTVSGGCIQVVFIDAEMERSEVVTGCRESTNVRSLLRAMMEVMEARDAGR